MLFRGSPRNVFLTIVWIIVALNLVYFVRRSLLSDYCNVDQLLKKTNNPVSVSSATAGDVTSASEVGSSSSSTSTDGERERVLTEDEFEGCERTADGSSSSDVIKLRPGFCMYTDEVDLRIIVLTFNRHSSLLKLLNSINNLEVDGAKVAVEIWIDRDKKTNTVHEATVSAARSFQWRHGRVRVHVRQQHVGIYGQWIDTWRPRSPKSKEMALILEDDLSLSPFAYRWLVAARNFYGVRSDVAGLTLQSESLIIATNAAPLVRPPGSDGPAFLYALVGSWGFAPLPAVWIAFQDWFRTVRPSPSVAPLLTPLPSAGVGKPQGHVVPNVGRAFSPLVSGLIMSKWYADFERHNKADTMWTMWFIYYCTEVRRLYTVYNNIIATMQSLPAPGNSALAAAAAAGRGCLAVNRREPGLHFSGSPTNNTGLLLTSWRNEFIQFHKNPPILGFNGQRITGGNRRRR